MPIQPKPLASNSKAAKEPRSPGASGAYQPAKDGTALAGFLSAKPMEHRPSGDGPGMPARFGALAPAPDYLGGVNTMKSSRRFFFQAASSWPESTGRSLP